MSKTWSEEAIRRLQDWSACPRCDYSPLQQPWCPKCGANLESDEAIALAAASTAAVTALQNRQSMLDAVPVRMPQATASSAESISATEATPPPVVAAQTAATRDHVAAPPADATGSSPLSVQSVLAVAGAGLFAIAAIVFTFFNPDLSDTTTRTMIVAVITLVFIAAAWFLAAARLQFSAEAVGALGMVFVILDIWAIATQSNTAIGYYGVAAIATLTVSMLFIALATLRRMRTWLWVGFVGVAITPAFVGYAVDTPLSVVLGHLGVGFAALLVHELARLLRSRFASEMRADHGTATTLQFFSAAFVFAGVWVLPSDDTTSWILLVSGVLAALAIMALLSTRNPLNGVWSALCGIFTAAAVAILPFANTGLAVYWQLAIVPAVTTGALVLLTVVSRGNGLDRVRRSPMLLGAGIVTIVSVAPAMVVLYGQIVTAPWRSIGPEIGIAAVWGVTALAVGLAIISLVRKSTVVVVIALILGISALAGVATWSEWNNVGRLALALAIGVVLAVLVLVAHRSARVHARIARTLLIGAHGLVVLGAFMSGGDSLLILLGGLSVVAAIAVLATAVPRIVQPVHAGIGFAYALALFAYALSEYTELTALPTVVGLTATLAIVVAIAVTVVRVVPVRFWAAALIVTIIPFVLSVGMLFTEISGWVGLATATAFVLSLILVVIHRAGVDVTVRVAAAALLVPTLAVVIISVVPQFVEQSTSPFTLPITAALVALVLPTTELAGRALRRLGHTDVEIRGVRLVLEISALITGSIAVLLTLVRAATDFGTTFLVLGIIGLGAAATGYFLKRRYAWIVAYISFTGALWSLLALNEVELLDAYVLPPALVAAVIGLIALWRGRRGLAFYASGLGVAIGSSLLTLAAVGNGVTANSFEWRTTSLLVASAALLAAGGLLGLIPRESRHAGLRQIRTTTLLIGLAASAAGLIQAVRYGWGIDRTVLGDTDAVMLPVLVFGLVATALAAVAAALLKRVDRFENSRLLAVPAVAFFVLAPVSAFRHGSVFPITLLIVTVLVLLFMNLTAVRAGRGHTALPPVWITFAFATIAGIAGWSEHSLFHVEPFSITLGVGLLVAGIIGWRCERQQKATLNSWPIGHRGSWRLLAPGMLVALGTSIMSTGTNPVTWRAILVIALALAAILLGNRLQLAAPFILGIVTLALENLVVFAVQIGETIDAATWWITLASAGAVLLVLAVSTERRTSTDRGVAARLRDLR